jgi:hypothetical protein
MQADRQRTRFGQVKLLVWKVLQDKVRYRSPDTEALNQPALMARAKRVLNQLRKLGDTASVIPPSPSPN